MNRAQEKAIRLLQIEKLLWAHSEGLTRAEIARRLGVNRSAITKYLDKDNLSPAIYEDELDGNKLKLDRAADLTKATFNLHEVMAIHLATRLLATRTDRQNPHAASALRKLGQALQRLDRNISQHLLRSADVMDEAATYRDPVYLDALEKLTEAWSAGRKVKVSHQMPDGKVFVYTLAPYFIEPYAVGQTAHVIGWREPPGALRTLKIERIRAVEITREPYTIPEDFDPGELLRDAWGIWYTEDEPAEVVLRFHPRVVHRVKESRWHSSQQLEDQPDGFLIWRAWVAEPQEMLPWIRGWGADVEVLEPRELREMMEGEVRRMAALYRVTEVPPSPHYQLLWGKTNKDRTRTHPLICHMLDVAQVALGLWNEVLTDSIRAQFAGALELEAEPAGRLIAFWAGLHDLGKASPCFQRKSLSAESVLSAVGLPFPKLFAQESCSHGAISTHALDPALKTETDLDPRLARRVAQAVGGHHGAWPAPVEVQGLSATRVGGPEWEAVRRELVRALAEVFAPPVVKRLGANRREENAFLTLFSGLTSVADWIGSMEEYFPHVDAPIDPRRYAERAAVQARQALTDLHWNAWQPPATALPFEDLFPFSPSPMQEAVIDLAERLDQPALVLIEAPTGSGKTEAALYLADTWARTLRQRGLYVAMPTMATSNQMFNRVAEMLHGRYPETPVEPLLVHSQARWIEGSPPPQMKINDERPKDAVNAMAWFLPRKRSLLAPFGVGTVDQSLLSVLQTRHFFVRLLGLSHKTVIFDEIHAYDTYMSTIFQRLLGWLRAVGASVVLLSATLPAQTRRELAEAYAGSGVEIPAANYPAITWAMAGQSGVVSLPAPESRTLALEWLDRDPGAIVAALKAALREGGCAAVICNTVARAQAVYRALEDARLVSKDDLTLFHARYPFAWRDEIEKKVLSRFGKKGNRPQKAIVVATQVIEQSLDLDFDVIASDLAPVDLLLQRAGRLHRHARESRPAPVAAPRLLVAVAVEDAPWPVGQPVLPALAVRPGWPGTGDRRQSDAGREVPDFDQDVYVYEPYVLLRSYLALRERDHLTLPQEMAALIESVYGEEPPTGATPAMVAALEAAREKMQRHEETDVFEARKRLIPQPRDEGLLNNANAGLEEDDPDVHVAFQALTRLGPPAISLVCLHATANGLNTEPDGSGSTVTLDQRPDAGLTAQLARYTVSVAHYQVVKYFREQEVPSAWREHPLLHDHRVVILRNGICPLPGTPYTLRLSRRLGLEIEEEVE